MISLGGNLSATSKNRLVIGLTFATGFLLGFLTAMLIHSLNPLNQRATHQVFQLESPQSSTINKDRNSTKVSIEVSQFQEIFKHQTISEQRKVLYTTLARSSKQELKQWWNESQKIERKSHRETAQIAIVHYLATYDPWEAVRAIQDVPMFQFDKLLVSIYREWAITNLDDAIESVMVYWWPVRNDIIQAILETRDDLSESERREIAIQLDSEETFLKLVSDSNASQSIAEPAESWGILLDDDVDDFLQTESLAIVAEAWLAQAGLGVLSNIYSDVEEYRVKDKLVKAIAHIDPKGALDYTRGLVDENEQSYLSHSIVREWARTDALGALSAVSTFEPPYLASGLEHTVLLSWAGTEPYELIENIESVSTNTRVTPLEIAFGKIARREPLEAIAKLSSVERYIGNTSTILNNIVNQWAVNQPDVATDWVLNNFSPEDPQRRSLLEQVLPALARQDPSQAFELAMAQPAANQGSELEYFVFRQITREGDIELAKELLPRVREKSEVFAYGDIAQALVDGGKTREALELGSDLEVEDRQSYQEYVVLLWSYSDPKDLYESLETLPTSILKSHAAERLIWNNKDTQLLTDDQIEHAKSFLYSDNGD